MTPARPSDSCSSFFIRKSGACFSSRILVSLYLFHVLQVQRTDHLPIDRVRHTREPPDVINVVRLPIMIDIKLNTGGGVKRFKVPYQVLFGQEYLAHAGRSFQDETSVSSFVSSSMPSNLRRPR